MAAEPLRCVFCGVNWAAKDKLKDNLILKLPADTPLSSHSADIAKLLNVPDLSAWELCKGKGKPPSVEPGPKVNMDKTVGELSHGAFAVFYVREKGTGKKKKEVAAPKEKKAPSDKCRLVICGDNWAAKEKLSENLIVECKKSETINTVMPDILKALALPNLDGWQLCKGKGKPPTVKAGPALDMGSSPESLGLAAAAVLYVKKQVVKKDAPAPKVVTRAIYQLGARVDVLNEDSEEWESGLVVNIRNDGSYDVELDGGKVEKYIDADDIRMSSKAAPKKEAKKELSKEDQKNALLTLMKEFPTKSVPEIGGLLKSNGFDVDQSRKILRASMVEEKKPVVKHVDAVPKKKTDTKKIKLNNPKEEFGIEFSCIAGKIFITTVDEGSAFARAGVKPCVWLECMGKSITGGDDLKEVVGELRREEFEQFDIEVDNREEAQAFVGCPAEVQVHEEWHKGVIVDIYGDYECFDIQLDEDGEIEEDMDFEDIRLLDWRQAPPPKQQASKAAPGGAPAPRSAAKVAGSDNPNGPPATPPPTIPDHVGIMRKKGDDLVGLYKLRRFALYGKALYYYSNESRRANPQPIGVLDLSAALAMGDKTKGDNYFGIGGKSVNRVYHFLCGSAEEKDEWLEKLAEQGVKTKTDCN